MGAIDMNTGAREHSIIAKDRKLITVSGVSDVPSFDESTVLLATSAGNMALEGRGLRIKVLDTKNGVVEVEGTLCGVLYYDSPADGEGKKSRFGRLFK
ncbi:MAG: sporulation protein YabP [Clostridia bacterium]|nr:sporulation protein YabP [Clostridia bacterium]